MSRALARLVLITLFAAACGAPEDSEPSEPSAEQDPNAEAATPELEEEPEEPEPEEPVDLGPPKRLFAKRFVVPVRAEPSREADRIGYLRAGATLMATSAEPVVERTERCRGGWWELSTGGYVCNVRDVIAFEGDRLPERRARQADREAPLPYEYAFIRRPVPMYRRLPNDEEAARYEGYRIPGAQPAEGEATDEDAEGEGEPAPLPSELAAQGIRPPEPTDEPEEAAGMSASMAAVMAATMDPRPANPTMAAIAAASGESLAAPDDEGDAENTGPTLDTLSGDRESVVMRHLMRGFYVSLDRDFRRGTRRYWRTQNNGFVPYRAVMPRSGSEFRGVALNQVDPDAPPELAVEAESEVEMVPAPAPEEPTVESGTDADAEIANAEPVDPSGPPTLPYAFVMARRATAYSKNDNGRFRATRGPLDYHASFPVYEEMESRGRMYVRGPEGRWFQERDLRVVRTQEPPDDVGPDDHWFDVNLANQSVVAYEGRTPVYVTLTSSGLPNRSNQPDRDYETLTGLFRVKSKHLTDTMDGDTAVDGPYSVDDVPYVMYFELAYAFHSAFWHNRFGRPKSHGCVNLSPHDARHLFGWADPPLPQGWHSVYPNEETPGTWIWVHGETMGRR